MDFSHNKNNRYLNREGRWSTIQLKLEGSSQEFVRTIAADLIGTHCSPLLLLIN